ncbi:uncharacterized protein LOC131951380 [Physella acuta]|uniref:uncharacterized protein LOC131951380 n=1 Tax=Physella acuta TaxID=109671 RepID=UPI0027DC84B5|nr:uncharacterized protein LOC131951380 [Physella acuta]
MSGTDEPTDPFEGTHEVQICGPGEMESNLDSFFKNCKKNPGHAGFVPVNDFKMEHLPPGYQDNDVVDLIKAMADLTVRICIKSTSLDRPEFIENTKDPYPCYNERGTKSLRSGTGRVDHVIQHTEEENESCPCEDCMKSGSPSKVWAEVVVLTARHVIFDESEAKSSKCRLWFFEDKCPMVTVAGYKLGMWGSGVGGDTRALCCVTHDMDVAGKLQKMWCRMYRACEKVKAKYTPDVDKLIVIVSHPHGCSMHVSVGHWLDKTFVKSSDNVSKYSYNACTCPGSSGALVYRLGSGWSGHPHSGGNSRFNYSGVWVDSNVK